MLFPLFAPFRHLLNLTEETREVKTMIMARHSDERGETDIGWLVSRHTFSFNTYYDPKHMHFGAIRVINEDLVKPGEGFGTHPHSDMEILSYVVSGRLEHRDSIGNGSIIRPGDLQRMTAGTGITHSEFNPSAFEPVHFLQIWIVPERRGLTPGYEQKCWLGRLRSNELTLIGSRDGRLGSVTIHQDVDLYTCMLSAKRRIDVPIRAGRGLWVQLISGELGVSGERLLPGDACAVTDQEAAEIVARQDAHFLLFDL